MAMTIFTEPGAACWASYLINGDASGMEDAEIALADAWLERVGRTVIDCGEEAYFSWSYDLATGADCRGGALLDYSILVSL